MPVCVCVRVYMKRDITLRALTLGTFWAARRAPAVAPLPLPLSSICQLPLLLTTKVSLNSEAYFGQSCSLTHTPGRGRGRGRVKRPVASFALACSCATFSRPPRALSWPGLVSLSGPAAGPAKGLHAVVPMPKTHTHTHALGSIQSNST